MTDDTIHISAEVLQVVYGWNVQQWTRLDGHIDHEYLLAALYIDTESELDLVHDVFGSADTYDADEVEDNLQTFIMLRYRDNDRWMQ